MTWPAGLLISFTWTINRPGHWRFWFLLTSCRNISGCLLSYWDFFGVRNITFFRENLLKFHKQLSPPSIYVFRMSTRWPSSNLLFPTTTTTAQHASVSVMSGHSGVDTNGSVIYLWRWSSTVAATAAAAAVWQSLQVLLAIHLLALTFKISALQLLLYHHHVIQPGSAFLQPRAQLSGSVFAILRQFFFSVFCRSRLTFFGPRKRRLRRFLRRSQTP